MRTAITLSLLPSSSKRPFVLGPDVRESFRIAADLGFDAVEIFPPSLEALDAWDWSKLTREFGVLVSTIGTGGGAVSQGLTLTDPDSERRSRAVEYVEGIIKRAADLGANAIIGSMQGRSGERLLADTLLLLVEALHDLARVAKGLGCQIFLEPLNRYESDLINTLQDGSEIIDQSGADNLKLLADLFHMNIEENNIPIALETHSARIGHVHFVDSNRGPAGTGHLRIQEVYRTLEKIGFRGYLAVEALPVPTPIAAATQASRTFRELLVSPK